MNINNNESGLEPVRKDNLSVGDMAYIIESNRFIREATIVKKSNSFCTIRFADSHGAITISKGRGGFAKEENSNCRATPST